MDEYMSLSSNIDTDKLQVIISEKNGLNQGLIWCGFRAEKNVTFLFCFSNMRFSCYYSVVLLWTRLLPMFKAALPFAEQIKVI